MILLKNLIIYTPLGSYNTTYNTKITPNLLVRKFCEHAQFLPRFQKTVPLDKSFKPGN